MGNAYLNKAPGSLIGGPEIKTDTSGNAGDLALPSPPHPNAGIPDINQPANAMEIALFFNQNIPSFCTTINNIRHQSSIRKHSHKSTIQNLEKLKKFGRIDEIEAKILFFLKRKEKACLFVIWELKRRWELRSAERSEAARRELSAESRSKANAIDE
nr:hypothetical protein Itr_chr11CG02370 [Ipomoea trifida]